MRKRLRKKMMKKCIIIIADETNLLTMTGEEREKAYKEYESFKNRYAYRKKYKNLKAAKPLYYFYPLGDSERKFYGEMSKLARRTRKTNIKPTVCVQSLESFGNVGGGKPFAQLIYEVAHPDKILTALAEVKGSSQK